MSETSVTMLQVVERSTNRDGKKKTRRLLTRRSLQVRKYNYVGLSDASLRPRPAISCTRRRQRGRGMSAGSAIHVRRLSEKCMVC